MSSNQDEVWVSSFFLYEIEWLPHVMRWWVDERVVHERVLWDPTPIPSLPLEFNVNLWHSRSRKLAGRLDANGVPAHAEIGAIQVAQAQIVDKEGFYSDSKS